MKTLPAILLLLVAASAARASDDIDASYFHPAASLYIHGDGAAASNLVAQGLALHPDDGKLKRLKELLEKQQEQQQDQNQDQQQNQEPPQNPEDQQNPDQEPPQEDNPPPEPPRAEQMSQDEAERLLDAMKQEEENKRLQLHPVMGAPVRVDKDW